MATAAQPAAEAGPRRIIVSEDLPLTVLTAVATTLVMNALGLGRTFLYVGVALSPLVADVIKNAFRGLRKRWLSLLAALLVLLGSAGRALAARLRAREHRAIGWQAMTATALLSAALTIGFFSVSELGRGSAILAARKMTFFGAAHSKKVVPLRLRVPANFVVRALGPTVVSYRVSAQDGGAQPVTPICVPRSGAIFTVAPTIVRCSATDSRGDRATKSFTVTVRRVPLVLNLPTTRSIEAAGPTGAPAPYSVTAVGVGGKPVAPRCLPQSGSVFRIGRTPVTCSAVDAAGHRARGQFSVLVRDDEAPTLSLPGDLSGTTTDKSGRRFVFAATATDRVDGTVRPSCDPASGSLFRVGTTTVKCTATDAHGNIARGTFAITVAKPTADKTPPTLALPANIRREATSGKGAVVTYRAAARDAADGSVATSCVPKPGATFPLGSTTVRCSTHDASANLAKGSFVVAIVDTTPPTLAPLPDLTAEASAPGGASVNFKASATDSVDGAVALLCDRRPGAIFKIGTTQVTCKTTDGHGNHASGTFGVSVVDTTPPVLKPPDALTVEATSGSGASVPYAVSAVDIVSGAVSPTCSRPPGPFPFGHTDVTCTATDTHGNHASGSFSVTVVDTTPPVLRLPSTLTVEATSRAGASVAYAVSAVDVVSGTISPTCSLPPGTFPLGQTTVTCTAADAQGNRGSGSFTVNIVDTTPPKLFLPGSFTITGHFDQSRGAWGATLSFGASAVDTVDLKLPVKCSPPSGTFIATDQTITRTIKCTAADSRGNSASGSFDVTISIPVIT